MLPIWPLDPDLDGRSRIAIKIALGRNYLPPFARSSDSNQPESIVAALIFWPTRLQPRAAPLVSVFDVLLRDGVVVLDVLGLAP